ncbi:hypothetical protein SMICM17S_08467 [Streptomyces microflavus]
MPGAADGFHAAVEAADRLDTAASPAANWDPEDADATRLHLPRLAALFQAVGVFLPAVCARRTEWRHDRTWSSGSTGRHLHRRGGPPPRRPTGHPQAPRHDPGRYDDAAVAGVRLLLGLSLGEPAPADRVAAVRMGTTVATNALLERLGQPTVLLITEGFRDALRIAYQNRPRLFDRHIVLPEAVHERVIEVPERTDAEGHTRPALQPDSVRQQFRVPPTPTGCASAAVVLMHGYRHPATQRAVAEAAREGGVHPGEHLPRGQPPSGSSPAATPPSSTPTSRPCCAGTSTRSPPG